MSEERKFPPKISYEVGEPKTVVITCNQCGVVWGDYTYHPDAPLRPASLVVCMNCQNKICIAPGTDAGPPLGEEEPAPPLEEADVSPHSPGCGGTARSPSG